MSNNLPHQGPGTVLLSEELGHFGDAVGRHGFVLVGTVMIVIMVVVIRSCGCGCVLYIGERDAFNL